MPKNSQLKNEHISIEVAPLGAEMQFLRTNAGDDLLWHGDPEFWTGRAPVLFPIVGRAPDDTIAVGDHSAPMPQHGFARRSVFDVIEQTDVMCRHVLTDNAVSRATYPFAFALEITHRLDGPTLHVTARVMNKGTQTMPFGFGFHPAFSWPLPKAGQDPHHVTLASNAAPEMRAIEDGLLLCDPIPSPFVDGDLKLREALFANDAMVFPNGSAPLRYGPHNGPSLEFAFKNLPDLALWRPVGAPFLCIEPWHGTAPYVGTGPQIADRPNTISLAAGDAVEFGYAVKVMI